MLHFLTVSLYKFNGYGAARSSVCGQQVIATA
jgi:hypothetical protein